MKYYEQLVDKRIFSYQDLIEIAGSNRNTISSLVLRYLQKGYIEQVRKNLYVAISMETGTSIANRFEIGCHILKHNLKPVYDAAKLQGYDLWRL